MRAEQAGEGPGQRAVIDRNLGARENRLVRIMCHFKRQPVEPPDQVKPTFRTKCPSLRLSTPAPAQCTMNASKMMARIVTTTQKKNTTMPGMAYPATVLALATATSYPRRPTYSAGV
jgi:hypothetical protein